MRLAEDIVSNVKVAVGEVIKIHNWYGVVLETHYDTNGDLSIIHVQTARNIFRGYGPEYIDVSMMPETVQLAALIELEQEIQTHYRLLNGAVERLLVAVHMPDSLSAAAD